MTRLPRSLAWLVARLAGPQDADSLIADLECELTERSGREGPTAAKRWVRREIVRSARPLVARRMAHALSFGLGGWRMWNRGIGMDVQHVARRLRRSPAFTLLAVGMLAVGIGATTAVFGLAYTVWLRPLPFHDPDRLVSIVSSQTPTGFRAGSSGAEMGDIRAGVPAFSAVAAYHSATIMARVDNEPIRLASYYVSSNFLSVLGVAPAIGRLFGPDDEGRPYAVLSDAFWRARFNADPQILGRTVGGMEEQFTVIGVMPRDFRFPLILEADCWVSLIKPTDDRAARFTALLARLKPSATIEQAGAELVAVSKHLADAMPATNAQVTLIAEPLDGALSPSSRAALGALLGLVGLFLIIACANLASLLAARNLTRRVELTLSAAIGAPRWRLARTLLLESTLLALVAGAVALALTQEALSLFMRWMPPNTPRLGNLRMNGPVFLFATVAAMLTAALSALAPVAGLRSLNVAETLSSTRTTGPRSNRGQHSLVVVQIALAAVLLVGAAAMVRGFNDLLNRDRGYVPEGVTTMSVSLPFDNQRYLSAPVRVDAMAEILRSVESTPGVTVAGAVTGFPGSALGILGRGPVNPPGRAEPPVVAALHSATPDYFRAMGVAVLKGRGIDAADRPGGVRVAVINEELERQLWPDGRSLGQHFTAPAAVALGDRTLHEVEVVGVVTDMHLGVRHAPDIFVPFTQAPSFWVDLVVRTAGDPTAMTEPVRQAVRHANPDVLIERATPLQAVISNTYGFERAQSALTGLVAVLGGLIALLSLYALLGQYVARRTRELGICLALGSSPGRLFWRVFRRGMTLSLAGTGAGIVAALVVTRVLRGQVFGLQSGSGWLIAVVVLGLALASAVVIALSARRVIAIDPIVSIRQT